MQRVWRLVNEAVALGAPVGSDRPGAFGDVALDLRRAAHALVARVAEDVERLRFNVAVAHVHEFANEFGAAIAHARKAGEVPADLAFALREAAEMLACVVAPMIRIWRRSAGSALGMIRSWPRHLGRPRMRHCCRTIR